MLKISSVRFFLALTFFCVPFVTQAADLTQATLQKADLKKEYTLTNAFGTAEVRLKPESFSKKGKVELTLEAVKKPEKYPVGDQELISSLYRYTIVAPEKSTLQKKVSVMLSYAAPAKDSKKVLKYWSAEEKKWKRLHTKDVKNALQARAGVKQMSAVIAVFKKKVKPQGNIVSGTASWYDWHGAASNDFPIGSRIRVTNTNTGAFVDSTVVSIGPFVTGRVVDLPRADFEKIAPLSAGLAPVTVQLAP